jgi:iron complex outermembrane receptor protein
MYAGVFWDIQHLLLEDIDRIEVISGPGGTLWGANAVNGVINIITKSTKDTQVLFAEAAAGSQLRSLGSLRYGGQIANGLTYRVYGTAFKRENTYLIDGQGANDYWALGKGGFRMDWETSDKNLLTLQGDIYEASPRPDGGRRAIAVGGNLLARWTHTLSDKADLQVQAFYDQTYRKFPNTLQEDLKTYDLDFQHRLQAGGRNEVIWGAGIRLMRHEIDNTPLLGFLPENKTLHVYNIFVQDKLNLVKDRLSLTLGSKLEHNNYSGFQLQPNARLAYTPTHTQLIWAALSRAVRNPARTDRELFANAAPEVPFIRGNRGFVPETLLAYELGWRIQPIEKLSLSLSTFYNFYDNIRSVEPATPDRPITFSNGVRGQSYGLELSAAYQLREWWRLRGGYTAFGKELAVKPGSIDLNRASAESNDPRHQFVLQSSMNLPGRLELGLVFRYVDKLPRPYVSEYGEMDARLAWKFSRSLEISVVGQSLVNEYHSEFIPASPSPRKLARSVYGKIICRI